MISGDIKFAKTAFELGFIDQQQLRKCTQIQNERSTKENKIPLAQLMLQLKFLTFDQINIVQNKIREQSIAQSASVVRENTTSNSPVIQEYVEPETDVQEPSANKVKRFNRYEILSKIGQGGMGVVYKVKDPHLGRVLALKLMKDDKKSKNEQQRFLREAKHTSKLSHPNIINVHDVGYDQGQFFFTMPFIEGIELKGLLNTNITFAKIIKIVSHIAKGLAYAHSLGFIHRDLKPANILIKENGEPIIMDFGVVKSQDESVKLTKTGTIVGTLGYMSPEQIEDSSQVDKRSDIYSLGVIIYEMITNQMPFEGDNQMELIYQIMENNLTLPNQINPNIPDELSQICLKAMAKNKEDRYQTMEELINDLEVVNELKDFLQQISIQGSTQQSVYDQTRTIAETVGSGITEMPSEFDRYKTISEIGRGGMGAVYKVLDTKLQREVALKIILSGDVSQKQIDRFMLEAKSMAKLKHPNIIEVYEFGSTPQNFFTMEYVDGGSFSDFISQDQIKPKQIAIVIRKCAEALAEVHKQGIIHRDIKPSNIMLNSKQEPKLMDFGLAKVVDNDLSKTGEVLGTPAYMPPEQAGGEKVDQRCDVYSLGVALYEALAKRPPFQGETHVNIIFQIMQKEPLAPTMLNPDIPIDLEAICLKAMEKDPNKRYQGADVFAQDLDNFIKNRPVIAKPATKWTYAKKWIIRNKAISIISAASLLIIVASIALVFQSLRKQAIVEKQKAQIEKTSALRAREDRDRALKAEATAKEAEATTRKQRDRALKAEKAAKEAEATAKKQRDRALKAEKVAKEANKKAQSTIYNQNLILAQKYNQEKKLDNAENVLEKCPPEKRHWEWYWLNNFLRNERKSVDITSFVRQCVLSPDGKQIAIAGDYLQIFDIATKKLHTYKGNKARLESCAYSPNGKYIASLGNSDYLIDSSAIKTSPTDSFGNLTIRESKTGTVYKTLPHHNRGTHCVFNPKGDKILCSYKAEGAVSGSFTKLSSKKLENVILWDMNSGRKILTLKAFGNENFLNNVNYCAFHPSGKLFATAGENKHLMLWKLNGTKWKTLKGHAGEVECCDFSPDGKKLVSTGSDKVVILWDIRSGKIIKKFIGHKEKILSCKFNFDSTKLVSAGQDRLVIIWDIKSGKKISTLTGHTGHVYDCIFTPSGKNVITGSDRAKLKFWNIAPRAKPSVFKEPRRIKDCRFSPDSKTLLSIKFVSGEVDFWDAASGIKSHSQKYNFLPTLRSAQLSSDGKKILIATSNGRITMHDIKTGKKLLSFQGAHKSTGRCIFSPDNKRIVAVGESKSFHLWDATLKTLPTKTIKRTPLAYYQGHELKISHVAFSPKGDKIATVSNDGSLRIWNAVVTQKETKARSPELTITTDCGIRWCEFSPDGNKVISDYDREIVLWDITKTSKDAKIAIFKGHRDEVNACCFSSDGKRIISASDDRTIRVWDATLVKGEKEQVIENSLLILEGHKGFIDELALSPNGRFIASGDNDGELRIWDCGFDFSREK